MNQKQASNLANQTHLPYFLGLSGIMVFLSSLMVFIFIFLCTDIPNQQIERVYLAKADAAVADDNPDATRLMINILHETWGEADCPQLRYQNGVLIQTCQIDEHWVIKIAGRVLTIPELEQRLVLEGDMDREIRDDPRTWSNRPVIIRADGSAPCKVFRIVRSALGQARMWKIEISAEKPPDDY